MDGWMDGRIWLYWDLFLSTPYQKNPQLPSFYYRGARGHKHKIRCLGGFARVFTVKKGTQQLYRVI